MKCSIRWTPEELSTNPIFNSPDRAALLAGEKAKSDKEYDMRLRQLALDARSKPTERTKTEEEIATDTARMFKDREVKRLKEQERQEKKLRGLLDDDEGDEIDEGFNSEEVSHPFPKELS